MKAQKLSDFKTLADGNTFSTSKNVGEMASSFLQLKFKHTEHYRIT